MHGAARHVLELVVADGQSGTQPFFNIFCLNHVTLAVLAFAASFLAHTHTVASSKDTEQMEAHPSVQRKP